MADYQVYLDYIKHVDDETEKEHVDREELIRQEMADTLQKEKAKMKESADALKKKYKQQEKELEQKYVELKEKADADLKQQRLKADSKLEDQRKNYEQKLRDLQQRYIDLQNKADVEKFELQINELEQRCADNEKKYKSEIKSLQAQIKEMKDSYSEVVPKTVFEKLGKEKESEILGLKKECDDRIIRSNREYETQLSLLHTGKEAEVQELKDELSKCKGELEQLQLRISIMLKREKEYDETIRNLKIDRGNKDSQWGSRLERLESQLKAKTEELERMKKAGLLQRILGTY